MTTASVKAVRFPVIETARVLPGACLCKNHNGPFIDTNIDLPIYGRVYLCRNCVTEMASMFETPKVEPPKPEFTKEEFEGTVNELRDSLLGDLSRLTSVLVAASNSAGAEKGDEPLFDLPGE